MGYEFVIVDGEPNDVRVLTLHRPDRMNSWNAQMRQDMRDAVEDTALNPNVRVLNIAVPGTAPSPPERTSAAWAT